MSIWSMVLVAVPLAQLPASPETSQVTQRAAQASAQNDWTQYEATVTSYLGEASPAVPPPAAPATIGLSAATATAPAPAACDPSAGGCQACQNGSDCCCHHGKDGLLSSLLGGCKDECKDCKKLLKYSTCDLYPHYPYYPKDHGYYYFRPYNYIHVLEHQQTVLKWGGDPRNPYSTQVLANLFVNVQHPVSTPLRLQGVSLPHLEDLLKP